MRHSFLPSLVAALVASTLGASPGHAQVVPEPATLPQYRPTVTTAPNGVPVVAIRTPSRAGVSRNHFQQFDVEGRGVILNNSPVATGTALGVTVRGNPVLGNRPAQVILNEVYSGAPSLLQGPIEVAGPRAEVVVANPAGITCTGCGFINASRATLAVATPIFGEGLQGRVTGFRAGAGNLLIGAGGFYGPELDQAALIAQAIRVEGTAHVRGLLAAVAGVGTVEVTPQGTLGMVTPKANLERPEVALDVSALGGMYAGQITLVGHGRSLGVRNQGTLEASAGDLVITAAGRLDNAQLIRSAGALRLAGDGIRSLGALVSEGDLSVHGADVILQGDVHSGGDMSLGATAGSLYLAGAYVEAGRALSLSAAEHLGVYDSQVRGQEMLVDAGSLYNDNSALLQTGRGMMDIRVRGVLDNKTGLIASDGGIFVTLQGDARPNGRWGTPGPLQLTAGGRLTLGGAQFDAGQIRLEGAEIVNPASSQMTGVHELQLVATGPQGLLNEGVIEAGQLDIQSTRLVNKGRLSATVQSINADEVTNTGILEAYQMAMRAGRLDNQGLINAVDVAIDAGKVDNHGRALISGERVSIAADELNNLGDGTEAPVILARSQMDLGIGTLLNTEHARIASEGMLNVAGALDSQRYAIGRARSIINSSATLESGARLYLSTDELSNTDLHFAMADFSITPERVQRVEMDPDGHGYAYDLTRFGIETRVVASDPGRISSGGPLVIEAGHLRNDKSLITTTSSMYLLTSQLENILGEGRREVHQAGTLTEFWRTVQEGRATAGQRVSVVNALPVSTTLWLGALDAPSNLLPAGLTSNAGTSGSGIVSPISSQP